MSNHSKPRKKLDKDSRYKAKDGRSSKKRSAHQLSKQKGSSSSSGSGSSRRKRVISNFDPSVFMKKVEEQTATQDYIPKNLFSDFAIEDLIKIKMTYRSHNILGQEIK